jgi:DNA-binding transcriptional MerR regulator
LSLNASHAAAIEAGEEPMVDKSPDAFRTISEVAEDLDLPQHVLRFWETRFPQIKPLKRGGNRRYYRPDDVALITGLKTLLYGQGYTIKGVQRILKEQGARAVQAVGRGGAMPAALPGDGRDSPSAAPSAPLASRPDPRQAAEPARRTAARPLSVDAGTVLRMALSELQGARNDLARALASSTET